MKQTARGIILLLLVCAGLWAKAQDTTISIGNVIVLSEYIPKLADPVKELTPPVAELPDAPLPKLTYSIVPVQFRTLSRLDIPKAIEMGKNTPASLSNNHIKLGFGNYSSPLAEIYLHNRRNEYGAYGFNFRHLSANGPDNASFADNYANLFGRRYFKSGTLYANFDYARNAIRYYGFDRTKTEPSADSLKQAYNTLALGGGWETREFGKNKIQSNTWGNFYNLSDKWGAQENDVVLGTSLKTLIKKDVLKVALTYNYSSYSDSLGKLARNYIALTPRYTPTGDQLKLNLGFNSTVYKDTGDVKFYLFPVADVEYEIEKDNFSVIGGIGGGVQKNSLRSFSTENPFMSNRLQMGNTINRFEGYLGLKGKASSNFGFTTRLFFNQYNGLALFVADSSVLRRFKPLYADARVFRFNIELGYQYSEKVRINLTANLYNYKLSDSKLKPWQLPTAEVKLNSTYNIGNKLLFTADVFFMNVRPATTEYAAQSTTLKGFTDFNFGVEYRYRKGLSLFVRLNNVSSVRYQRWYNYPVLGLNAMGGITFSL